VRPIDDGSFFDAVWRSPISTELERGEPLSYFSSGITVRAASCRAASQGAAPRVFLYEDEKGDAVFEYDQPSSLFGQFDDEQVSVVARGLDAALEHALRQAAE
jgi:hypothetical protein